MQASVSTDMGIMKRLVNGLAVNNTVQMQAPNPVYVPAPIYEPVTFHEPVAPESDQGFQNLSQVNSQPGSKKARKSQSQKLVSEYKYPCILPEHEHSLSDCRVFFLMTSKERAEARKLFGFRHCLVCLQSNTSCTFRKCENLSSIPKVLVCKDCINEQKENKNLRIYSVLFCFRETHFKASGIELMKELENYIPGFKSFTLEAPIGLVSHFQDLNLARTNGNLESRQSF